MEGEYLKESGRIYLFCSRYVFSSINFSIPLFSNESNNWENQMLRSLMSDIYFIYPDSDVFCKFLLTLSSYKR